MNEHTKEPWAVHPDAAGVIVAASDPDMSLLGLDLDRMASFMNEHDARRVVACVNLCVGTPTASIEAAIAEGHTVDYIAMRAEEMRDAGKKVVATARELLSHGPGAHGRLILEVDCMNLESVIASAEAVL